MVKYRYNKLARHSAKAQKGGDSMLAAKQANTDIRAEVKKRGLCYWQLAELLGLHSQTVNNWLRIPLTDERRKRILDALEQFDNQ